MSITQKERDLTTHFLQSFCLEVQRSAVTEETHQFRCHEFAGQPYVASSFLRDGQLHWTVSRGGRGVFFQTDFPLEFFRFEYADDQMKELYNFFGLDQWTHEMCETPTQTIEKWRSTIHAANLCNHDFQKKGYRLLHANTPGQPFFEVYQDVTNTNEAHVVFTRKINRGPYPKVEIDGLEVHLNSIAIAPYVKLQRTNILQFGSIFDNFANHIADEYGVEFKWIC